MLDIECLWESNDGLGETPIWFEEESSLYWADHVGPAIDLGGKRRPSIKRLNMATNERKSGTCLSKSGPSAFVKWRHDCWG